MYTQHSIAIHKNSIIESLISINNEDDLIEIRRSLAKIRYSNWKDYAMMCIEKSKNEKSQKVSAIKMFKDASKSTLFDAKIVIESLMN